MTIIGSASVQIRALDKLFEKDVKAAVAKIKDVAIKVTAEFDDNGVTEKVNKLRREASAQTLTIRAEADTVKADEDLTHLHKKHDQKEVKLDATASTTGASAQLNYVSRDRIAWIHPIIDPGAFVTAKNILESLSGINTLRTLKDSLKELATGFDTASLKAVALSSGILTLISSVGWLAAEAFAAGEGVARLVGFFAMAPTLIGAATTAIVANHLAWNNFGDAMSENATTSAKALALLPPNARDAAVEVKKLWTEIKKPVQGAFWEGMGDSLQSTLGAMAPALSAGLTKTAKTLGVFTSGFLQSFKTIAENKTLDAMFDNLTLGIEALSRGITPFIDALNTLGFVGSKYLPQLGNWLSDLAERFNNFISKAAANGDIDRWINNAVNAMEDLWSIGGATIGIFQGLNSAFREAGAKGLDGLATSLRGVEEIVKGEVFQSQFVQIMTGMMAGAHAAKEGFAEFFQTMGNMSEVIGSVFALSGGVVKELLSGISQLMAVEGFQVGLIKAFGALQKGLNDLGPSFENVGKIFGGLLEISAAIFSNIAPVINNATQLIAGVIDDLKGGFIDVIPVLMGFVDAIITAFDGPVRLIAGVIGDLVSAFSDLPGPITLALLALGAGILLAPKITAMFDGMRTGMQQAAQGAKDAKPGFVWLNDVSGWAKNASKSLGDAGRGFKTGFAESVAMARTATADFRAAGSLAGSGFVGGVRSGIGAIGFLGSEIGQAIAKSAAQAAGAASQAARAIGTAVADGMGRATEAVKRATGPLVFAAQQAWADVKSGFGSSFDSLGSVRDGFNNLGTSISNFAANAKYYTQLAAQNTTAAFVAMGDRTREIFTNVSDRAKSAFTTLGDNARNAFSNMVASTRPFQQSFGFLMDDVRDRTIYMEKRVRDMATSMANAGRDIGTGFRAIGEQTAQAASYVTSAVEPVTRTIAAATTAAVDGVQRGVQAVRDTGAAMATNLSANFAPVGAAFGAVGASIRDGVSNVRTHMGNLVGSFGDVARSTGPIISSIGNVTGAIGSVAGGGLARAAHGLMGALGGPWGLALAGAAVAMSMFGDAQRQAKADTDQLATSLDKQTGAITAMTKTAAADLLNVKEKFLGFDIGDTALDNAKKLGLSTEMVSEAASGNVESGAKFKQFGEDFKAALTGGTEKWEEFAEANGLSNMEQKTALNTWNELRPAVEAVQAKLTDAQKRIIDVATATGTNSAQAAILSANYATLESRTSSASDKFNALKNNLDVLNKGQLSAAESSKNYYTQLDAGRANIDAIKEANKGLVTNLFEVGKGFDMSNSHARDLHTALSGQRDAILQLGTSALDQALKSGKSVADARQAAIDAMGPAIGTLKADLEKMGFAPDVIDAITESLGLVPDKVTTALGIENAEKVRAEIALTQMAAFAYATGNYTAALAALPDEAKAAITETFNLGDAFAKGDYEAVLKALDRTGPGRDAAVASIIGSVGGDKEAFRAKLTALDETTPGVRSAITNINGVQGKTVSIIAEDKSTATIDYIKRVINGIERHVKVTVDTIYNNYAGKAGNVQNAMGKNGGITLGASTAAQFAGKFPLQRFANGGIEQHVAQIARGGTMRLWAEPETGGEAYIPLALNKRGRSKKILEEVARMFGFGMFQMFADGGLNGGTGSATPAYSPSSAPQASAATGPLVAVYPSAALDEEKVGEIAARRLFFALQNR